MFAGHTCVRAIIHDLHVSCRLSVATGGDTSENMPMVIRLPHTQTTGLDAYTGQKSRDYSLLGFGDVVREAMSLMPCWFAFQ